MLAENMSFGELRNLLELQEKLDATQEEIELTCSNVPGDASSDDLKRAHGNACRCFSPAPKNQAVARLGSRSRGSRRA